MSDSNKTTKVSMGNLMPVIFEALDSGKDVLLAVSGNSMLPFLISNRDYVVLRKEYNKAKKGDVVLYKMRNGKYALHRIVGVDLNGDFEIIGDGQLVSDYPVSQNQIIAKAVAVKRKGVEINCNSFKWKLYSLVCTSKLFKKLLFKRIIKRGVSDK